MSHWHEYNPWQDKVVYVPIEELAEALAGGQVRLPDGSIAENDKERLLEVWDQYSHLLDAYILPGQALGFSAGIRYGSHGPEYLSLYIRDQSAVRELFERYSAEPSAYAPN